MGFNKLMNSNYSIKQRITKASEIPKDILTGIPVLSVTGISELNLENHNGILEYTDVLIRIRTRCGQLKISGKSLQVEYYTNDEVKICGKIDSIEFGCHGGVR